MTFFVEEELSSALEDAIISHFSVDEGLSISGRGHPTRSTRSSALVDAVISTFSVDEKREAHR